MYYSKSIMTLIADHKAGASSEALPKTLYRKNLQKLAELLTEWSYYSRGCSMVLNQSFYCYVYLDPRKPGEWKYQLPSGKIIVFAYKPFYVGKSIGKRSNNHLSEAKNENKHSLKIHTIRAILKAGMLPIIKTTGNKTNEALAFAYEIDLIAGIGRRDKRLGPLANLTDGGEGTAGSVRSIESRKKMSAWQVGRIQTQEHREKNRAANKRVVKTPEWNRKNSEAQKGISKGKGRPWSERRHAAGNVSNRDVGRGIHIKIDDKLYTCLSTAARELNISIQCLSHRLKSDTFDQYIRL